MIDLEIIQQEFYVWGTVLMGYLLVWLCCMMVTWKFGKLRTLAKKARHKETSLCPTLSIIVEGHNQAASLRKSLPILLQQRYSNEFEVIVVDIHSNDDTKDVLEEMESRFRNLSHTAVPASARDISLNRLALSLGLRSAIGDWVVLLKPDYLPSSQEWLNVLMSNVSDDIDAVLAYSKLSRPKGWKGHRIQFFHLWQQMLWMPYALKHRAYMVDENVLVLRKQALQGKNLFVNSCNLIGSVHTLLVNHNIQPGRIGLALQPETAVSGLQPNRHLWKQERVFFVEERKAIKGGWGYRVRYALQVIFPQLTGWLAVATSLYFLWAMPYLAVIPVTLWIVASVYRLVVFQHTAKYFGIRTTGFWWGELSIPFWDASAWLTWKCTNKNTFRKKFV
ncbi:MAG: glycosyltransferase [Bacteroidaceae bacterium]|nr:glycosyltransferase [Bacteroidaceae bacterium]